MTKAQIKWINKQLEVSTTAFTSRSWDDIHAVFDSFNSYKGGRIKANDALKIFYDNAKTYFKIYMRVYKDSQNDLTLPHYIRENPYDMQEYMQHLQEYAMQNLAKARIFYRFYKEHKDKL